MREGLNKSLFFPKMSIVVLYFSFSRARRCFEKNEQKNKTTSVYGLLVSYISLFVFTGLPYGNPSRKVGGVCLVLFFFFSVSVKVLPLTPLLSGIFVHRALCPYFLRIERIVEMRRFLWWAQ